MGTMLTRRNLLRLAGGSAAGLLLSPVPWKLTDDLAIWTQNWSRIPRLAGGPVTVRSTHCTLCPASCGARVRCVGGRPVSLAGEPAHPLSRGALCPLGLAGHQLPWHPRRVRGPVALREGAEPVPVPLAAVLAAAVSAVRAPGGGSVALLDARPGRAVSEAYRRALACLPGGVHVTVPPAESRSLGMVEAMFQGPSGPLGYDLDAVRCVLGFGTPLLEGWDVPGRALAMRFGDGGADRPRLIQAETRASATAQCADRWLPLRPGTELALALGIANTIVRERLCDAARLRAGAPDFDRGGRDYLGLVEAFPPGRVSDITGLAPDAIVAAAREFASARPALAVGGGDPGGGPLEPEAEAAIAALNFLVGSVGPRGAVVPRRALPLPWPGGEAHRIGPQAQGASRAAGPDNPPLAPSIPLQDVADGSVRVLLIEGAPGGEALPAEELERVLVPGGGALVLSLSPWAVGPAEIARYAVPAPAWLERLEEAATPPGAARAAFGLSVPLLTPPEGAVEPLDFLRSLARAAGRGAEPLPTAGSWLEDLCRAIEVSGRGEIVAFPSAEASRDAKPAPPAPLAARLARGGVWIDDPAPAAPLPPFLMMGPRADAFESLAAAAEGRLGTAIELQRAGWPLVIVPFGLRGACGDGPVPTVASKLYRESELRQQTDAALMSPETGRSHGIQDGARVRIETPAATVVLRACFDPAVMPGVIHVAAGPGAAAAGESRSGRRTDLFAARSGGGRRVRRFVPARMREA